MPILDNREAHRARFDAFRQSRDLRSAAFDMVGGGDFERIGFTEACVLDAFAPVPDGGLLVDVGCGPGRLARYLTAHQRLRYLGTDVVPELLDVARAECQRPDWRFEAVSGFEIPCDAATADIVAIFSVFTNVLPEQSFLLVREAARVLRPGGRVLISYLDMSSPRHQPLFLNLVEHQAARIDPLVFLDKHFLDVFAVNNGMEIEAHFLPDEVHAVAPAGSRLLDGRKIEGPVTLNQAVAVLLKSA